MRPKHISVEGEFYFLTTHCAPGIKPFEEKLGSRAFMDILKEKHDKFNLRLFAYVIMPNHTHLLLQLPENVEVSNLMNHLNGASARSVNSVLNNQYEHIWQGGFHDEIVRSATDFGNKVNYIHENPVSKNLVEKAIDYEFSSARFYSKAFGEPHLDMDGFDDFALDALLESFHSVLN
jgi:REP element-mobilizing transposase RayT